MPVSTVIDRVLVAVALLACWQLANLWAGDYWVASPWSTIKTMIANGPEILWQSFYTFEAAILGLALGAVPGIALAFLFRRLPLIETIMDPFMVAGYGLPKLALAPLFILWFGVGVASKIVLVATVVFFILYFNVQAGIRSVDVRLLMSARILGASEFDLVSKVVWPASLPYVFAGFQIALPYAIGGVVISELISSNRGLGYLIQFSAMNFSTNGIFAAVVAVALLCVGTNWVSAAVERHLLRRPASNSESLGI